jgi:hypothetical protein
MPLGHQPWWVRAGAYVGVPTLILGAVMWWVDRKFDAHVVDTAVLVRHLEEETQRGWQTISILQRVCLNTARTEDDKMACIAIGPAVR